MLDKPFALGGHIYSKNANAAELTRICGMASVETAE